MLGNLITFVIIALVLLFGFMFVKRWNEEGFDAAKAWLVALGASVAGAVAMWWPF
jgi:hypothetical protein